VRQELVRASTASVRLLDEFERLGLDAVRRGEELVWPREAPTRMFGAICAKANCLHCHANAEEGDLVGAFMYYL
jgi:cytochrome c